VREDRKVAVIDHLVYVVPELDDAIDRFERELGVRPVIGGRHQGMGTWNALLALRSAAAASYLELIAADPDQPDPGGPRPFGIDDDAGPRLVTFAMRPSDGESLDDIIATVRRHGFEPGDATPMSRTTPDGDLLAWHLTMPTLASNGLVPFLIDWGDTPMPSATIPVAAGLESLTAGTADERVAGLLAELQPAPLALATATDRALSATLRSDTGSLRL